MRTFSTRCGIAFFAIAAVTLWAIPSTAQMEWEKYPGNPMLDLGPDGAWDDSSIAYPSLLFDGTEYKMWYAGRHEDIDRIGYATSPDGIVWTKYPGNPVLDIGPSGSWDDKWIRSNCVIFNGTEYKMWFAGYGGNHNQIGYASSPDGIVWTKYAYNPVLDRGASGSWEDGGNYGPGVLFDGTEYRMWYSGQDGSRGHQRIGYASSPDGIVWTKYLGNPVLNIGPSGSWDDKYMGGPSILFNGVEYEMFYGGYDGSNYRIGYASSPDGIVWTKYAGNPVLDLGPSDSWDDRCAGYHNSVLYDGMSYKIWYHGKGTYYRIGYATSVDDCWDIDQDGFYEESCGGWDCDDSNPDIHMDATEVCDNGVDDDCDRLVDLWDPDCCEDVDGDGFTDVACGGPDCDDSNPTANPGMQEIQGDGVDNDCDGMIDEACFVSVIM